MVGNRAGGRSILKLLEMQAEAHQSKYQRLLRDIAMLQDRLQIMENRGAGVEVYEALGLDLKWKTWIEQYRQKINLQLAELHAERLDVLADLKRANGKAKAYEEILQRSVQAKRMLRRKKDAAEIQASLLLKAHMRTD